MYDYPISIKIKADTGQNDLLSFISSNWKIIERLQKEYEVPGINKIKNSKTKINQVIRARDSFIYENQKLPKKDLLRLAEEKFNLKLDLGNIYKIISRENKKRKIP